MPFFFIPFCSIHLNWIYDCRSSNGSDWQYFFFWIHNLKGEIKWKVEQRRERGMGKKKKSLLTTAIIWRERRRKFRRQVIDFYFCEIKKKNRKSDEKECWRQLLIVIFSRFTIISSCLPLPFNFPSAFFLLSSCRSLLLLPSIQSATHQTVPPASLPQRKPELC